jgi:hypothetical protein
LEKEAARFEMEIINASKKEGRQGIVPVPGAKDAVHVLEVRLESPLVALHRDLESFPEGFFNL